MRGKAGAHRTVGGLTQLLAGYLQPEVVEAAECGRVSAGEARANGSGGHVEVFRMGGVRTSIIGRPRPSSRQRRADQPYTLNREEPQIRRWVGHVPMVWSPTRQVPRVLRTP